MITKTSRYAKVPVSTEVDAQGRTTQLLALREPVTPTAIYQHTPSGNERLDHVAHRYYRDSTQYWRIADACSELDPFRLVVPGRPLPIPPDR